MKHILLVFLIIITISCGSSNKSEVSDTTQQEDIIDGVQQDDNVDGVQQDDGITDTSTQPDTQMPDSDFETQDTPVDNTNGFSLTECGDVPVLGGQGTVVSDECLACVNTNCCSQAEACAAQPECLELRQCFFLCYAPGTYCFGECSDCIEECKTQHGDGMAASDTFNSCRNGKCANECEQKPYLECAGSVEWPQPSEPTYEVVYLMSEYFTGEDLVGVLVKFCSFDDTMCQNSTIQGTSGADATVTLTVPSSPIGIDGYLEVSGEGLIPNLFFFSFTDNIKRYAENGQISLDPFAQSTADVMASLIGTALDPERGHLVFGTRDCNDRMAAEMRVVVDIADESSTQAYLVDGLPSTTATETTAMGLGGVMNLPPGTATIEMIHVPTQTLVGRRTGIIIRAGHLTHTMLPITPLE